MELGGWLFMGIAWSIIFLMNAYSFYRIFRGRKEVIVRKRAALRNIWIEQSVLNNIRRWHGVKMEYLLAQGIKPEEIKRALYTLLKNRKIRKIVKGYRFAS